VEDYKLEVDGTLLYKNRVNVPNVQELKLMILKEMNNVPYAGHPGYQKRVAAVKSKIILVRYEKGNCRIHH
jgi:hypothetical protein